MHPAAALLNGGCACVVGTLWPMDDQVGASVVSRFYDQLTARKDISKSAVSLGKAVEELGSQDVPLTQRINLMHFGI